MRSVLVAVGVLVLLCTAVGSAAAAPSVKQTEHVRDLGCNGVATSDGSADFYASLSDVFGSDAFMDVWAGEPGQSDLVWTRDFSRSPTVAFTATTANVTIPLVPSGEARIVAALDAVDTIAFNDGFKEGNHQDRIRVTGTLFAVTGTLTLPGGSPVGLDPLGCSASDAVAQTFFTQPHSSVRSFTSSGGFCQLTNAAGDSADVFIDMFDEDIVFIDAFVEDSGGAVVGASGGDQVTGGGASIVLDEYDPDTGDGTGVTGSATVTLTESADDIKYVLRSSNLRHRITGSLTNVAGTLATSLGSFSLDPCVITMLRHKEIITPSNGPKPTGKPPVNDLPSGAIKLRVGGKATTSTRAAQGPSEAGFPCMFLQDPEGGIVSIPVEHTVWYKVTGTGGQVTVSTAKSDFDTVLAVYAGAANANATVACVDDTPVQPFGRTLQASATFPTVAGTTYWIQVGGFQEDEGVPLVPYGNLRISVR